ncbi:hypothetical protein FIV42_21165 [Persicimonas caeni]|uniref:DUF883 domain-containing protein n=1 Tax=Persicimonas caeni TaxID=2292766 RepID=A0A4Y6PXW7_PERCE|nr:hypothetical protein [Persicimonas caeni]QDG53161.1 hypothetical protein FIV42_21165 [Persicimonas caeni]QED34383.1 hypothetical protein FRD00_21160 [Persicimonas caeni]
MATRDRGEEPKRHETETALTRRTSTELTQARAPDKHFDERTAEIRASIDEARRQISDSLDDIQVSVQETLDWKAWVSDHPWQAVGIGFAVGFYLGLR